MPYAIFSKDKPNSLKLRNDTRFAHREFLATQMALMIETRGKQAVTRLAVVRPQQVVARLQQLRVAAAQPTHLLRPLFLA